MFVRLPVANPDFILRWVTEKFSCPSGFKLRWGLKNVLAFRALKFSLIRGRGGPGPWSPSVRSATDSNRSQTFLSSFFTKRRQSRNVLGWREKERKTPFYPQTSNPSFGLLWHARCCILTGFLVLLSFKFVFRALC